MRTITTVGLLLALLAVAMPAADARHGHGHGGGHAMHVGGATGAGGFADDKRHGNDPYTKAASDEEDRLLNSKLKSICRGC
ncbi:hypothetical protein AB7M49_006592 [Bradyrhizobium elkanii]|uniref:Uncharacterized protein n=1 Tax=Bradyrhizobium elkanii TaxID=29448 RepID=A0A7Y8QY55_BRAEL|nr:hypothetical protein [Bradyrhizobium elkanii]MBP1296510.1 hypothetical protein [Bradyrhizobium elkanii]MBP2434856.1 hypothetical protein [Bradyrhizobium elkanii]MCP1749605.1 hypothetical protein [Bradyrhizobium elkanii]MCP1984177.1 hypothetical protein [Bradyrhizobium elkanii]MCS3890101.1 hypothetical protein [Bradyrhizobium elkanii]